MERYSIRYIEREQLRRRVQPGDILIKSLELPPLEVTVPRITPAETKLVEYKHDGSPVRQEIDNIDVPLFETFIEVDKREDISHPGKVK